MYINGVYTGMVFNVANNSWQKTWQGWWYHGLCINGILGPGIRIDHILMRGFVRSVYNNNFGSSSPANTNIIQIDHCTFIENVCVSDVTQVANVRVLPSTYGPSYEIRNCIISDHPLPSFADSTSSAGLLAQSTNSLSNPNFTVCSQSNQYWAVGKPIPGTNYKNNNIIDSRPTHTDYENEQPIFFEYNALPYSTARDTTYGTRDVGWSVIDVAILPVVTITSMPATVSCDVTTYTVSGTNNINVVGIMGWSNTATMVTGALLAALDWSVGGIDLAVGTNTIVVYGTNIYGDIASDHIAVLRGVPFVDITNVTPCIVGYANATTVIGGTNNENVVGEIRWQNLTGGTIGGAARVGDAWTALITGLVRGDNTVQVIGTNVLAQQSSDGIVVHRKTAAEAMPQIASNALIFPLPGAVLSAPMPTNIIWWVNGITDDEDGTNVSISCISVHVSNTLAQVAVVTNTIDNLAGVCGWQVPESLAGGGTTYVVRFEVTDSSGLTNSMVFNGNAFTIVPEGVSAIMASLALVSVTLRRLSR